MAIKVSVEVLRLAAGARRGELRQLAPIVALHRSVELGERMHVDAADRCLRGLLVLSGVIDKYARRDEACIGGGQEAALSINAGVMNRREWLRTAIIVGLLVLAIVFAQSRRNCEIPGSTWIPCIWGTPLKQPRK